MPRATELTDFERGIIVGLHLGGKHTHQEIAAIVRRSKGAVQGVIERYIDGGFTTATQRSGRSSKLSKRDERQLVREVKKDRSITLEPLTEAFNKSLTISVSSRTVQRTLHNYGFYSRVAKKKPLVTEKNKKIRLEWCKRMKNWKEEWDKVIFSDESRYLIFKNDAHKLVWRRCDEKYKQDCLAPTVKNSDGVMVWGCFCKDRMGPLILVDGNINAAKYIQILDEHLLPYLQELGIENYIFQDDNAPCHTAKSTVKWKESKLIDSLEWPSQSPDLNPIEHLWDELERRIRRDKVKPKNKAELFAALEREWGRIHSNVIDNLVNSMPRRVKAVLDAKGGATPY
jgi:transposase